MKKLRILFALCRFLLSAKGDFKYTINRNENGEWFQVEPPYIWISADQAGNKYVTDVAGDQYVRVGGGRHAGEYIKVGHAITLNDVLSDREPNV